MLRKQYFGSQQDLPGKYTAHHEEETIETDGVNMSVWMLLVPGVDTT